MSGERRILFRVISHGLELGAEKIADQLGDPLFFLMNVNEYIAAKRIRRVQCCPNRY
jgi:hypothetical protein